MIQLIFNYIISDDKGVELFEEALTIKDKDTKCQVLFKFLAYALDDINVACAFAEWFLDHSKVKDEIKELFWLRSMDKEAFAVYEYYILGIGNEKSHDDNVDRIAGFLYLDEVIRYLLHFAGDSQYHQIGVELELIWSEKTQFGKIFNSSYIKITFQLVGEQGTFFCSD